MMDRLRSPQNHPRMASVAALHQPYQINNSKLSLGPSKGKLNHREQSLNFKKASAKIAISHEDICLPGSISFRQSKSSSYSQPSIDTVIQEPPSRRRQEPQEQWSRTMVEIMPGHSVPMIGTSETIHAWDRNQCTDTTCVQCETFLYCIDSASMVLCPACRSISPVETAAAVTTSSQQELVNLGLGMTVEHILEALAMTD